MAEYAVIVPTLNEVGNVEKIVELLEGTLQGLDWEVIFVDDNSKDGTQDVLQKLALHNRKVRYIRRRGRRGLASACVEGMLSTAATYMAVMDADLQHDESRLPEMFKLLASGEANIVVGTRYTAGGGIGEWDKTRASMSKFATFCAQKSLVAPCSDPMSGFFALHRDIVEKVCHRLQLKGFKILFDILSTPGLALNVKEVSYTFKERVSGATKLNYSVIMDFGWLLLSKYFGRICQVEFIMFCLIGLSGVLVHMAALALFYKALGWSFLVGQSAATIIAMTSNYFLNNRITFGEQCLRGKDFFIGYLKFVAACSIGALANVAIADYLFEHGLYWVLSACAGTVAGAIINYFFAKFFIWNGRQD